MLFYYCTVLLLHCYYDATVVLLLPTVAHEVVVAPIDSVQLPWLIVADEVAFNPTDASQKPWPIVADYLADDPIDIA